VAEAELLRRREAEEAEEEDRRRKQQREAEAAAAAASAAAASTAAAAAAAAAAAEEEEARRRKREAEEAERAKLAAQRASAKAAEEERKRRQREEDEAETKAATATMKVQRAQAEKRLERTVGLPPRERVAEPQEALLAALTRPAKPEPPPKKKTGPCDKCDGPHHEDDCPHFKGKAREKHKDAWDKYSKDGKGSGEEAAEEEPVIIPRARVVPQPGDGSCLFHSLSYGLRTSSAEALRAKIADFIAEHPDAVVADNPLKDWVLWDAGTDVKTYANSMRAGSRWGGAVEIAVCALIHEVPVHVYERVPKGFARISAFGAPGPPSSKAVNVTYGGRVHYDALEIP